MTRPTLLACSGAAVLAIASGCAAESGAAAGTPTIRWLRLADLPEEPAHLETPWAVPVGRPAEEGADVAEDLIVEQLEDQGSQVLDVGTAVLAQTTDRATIRVWVAFATSQQDHIATFDVRLRHTSDGWVVDHRTGGR